MKKLKAFSLNSDYMTVCFYSKSITAHFIIMQTAKDSLSEKMDVSDPFEDKHVIISGENVHKTYLFGLEGVAALRGVSVSIRQGEFVIILGNSGGGKTSLLNILGTIDKLTKVRCFLIRGTLNSTSRGSRRALQTKSCLDSG